MGKTFSSHSTRPSSFTTRNLCCAHLSSCCLDVHRDEATVAGFGDHHDHKFDKWERTGVFKDEYLVDGTISGIRLHKEGCQYKIRVYPSQKFYKDHNTELPFVITAAIVTVFIFTVFMFLFYDRLVEKRQDIVLTQATKSAAIVSSLFPKSVTDRLMQQGDGMGLGTKTRLKGFLNGEGEEDNTEAAPIADIFPHCTVRC